MSERTGKMRMTIRARMLAAQVVMLALFVLFVSSQMYAVVRKLHASQERFVATETMLRISGSVDAQIDELKKSIWEYATWDDAYNYLKKPDPAFIDGNLYDPTFRNNRLNFILFKDCAGHTVWGRALDLETGASLVLPDLEHFFTVEGPKYIGCKKPVEEVGGFGRFSRGMAAFVMKAVTNNNADAPPLGFMVMGRFLGPKEVSNVERKTRAPFSLIPFERFAERNPVMSEKLTQGGGTEVLMDPGKASQAFQLYRDLHGDPLFVIQAAIPITISRAGEVTVHMAVLASLMAGCFVILASFVIVNRMVSLPMRQLQQYVDRLVPDMAGKEGSVPDCGCPSCSRKDEIGDLSRKI